MLDDNQIEAVIDNMLEGEESRSVVINKANWVGDEGIIKIYSDETFSIHDDAYRFKLKEQPIPDMGEYGVKQYTIYSADGNWPADMDLGVGFEDSKGEVSYTSGDIERSASGPDAKYVAAAQVLWNII